MIVSRKNCNDFWKNLEGYESRLSGPYYGSSYGSSYQVTGFWHRLYGGYYFGFWDINDKPFRKFKGV